MTKSKRIALVSAFPPGKQSLNEYGLHLAKGLATRPDVAEVIVIADRLSGNLAELDLGPRIRVERVWTTNSATAGFSILRALRRAAPDGAIWNLKTESFGNRKLASAFGMLAPAIARAMGIPSGIIAHDIVAGINPVASQLGGQRLRSALARIRGEVVTRAMLSASYMTVMARGYRDHLNARYRGADVPLIPHGTFDTTACRIIPLDQRPMRIVTMGKFGTHRRLETLLEAFDQLRQDPRLSNLELVIGGTDHPSAPGYLASLADARKRDAGVVFAGYVAEDDIPAFFGEARLSAFDHAANAGIPGALQRTASYGTVPVFPRIGDFVDICRDEGFAGCHYLPGDAHDMAQAMFEMLDNADAAQAIADSNHAASLGMPFSDVIAFHLDKLALPDRRPRHAAPATA